MKKTNILILFLLIIVLPAGTIFSYRYYQTYKEKQRNKLIFEKRKSNWLKLKQKSTDEVARFNSNSAKEFIARISLHTYNYFEQAQ